MHDKGLQKSDFKSTGKNISIDKWAKAIDNSLKDRSKWSVNI